LIENYIREPAKYEKEYLEFLQKESVQQYNDYFESEKDEVETLVMSQNQVAFSMACENWQIPRQDSSSFKTFPVPEWNREIGFWPNAVTLLKEVQNIGEASKQIDQQATIESISQSSLVKKKTGN
jgi:septum formation topological specificity factor MinE